MVTLLASDAVSLRIHSALHLSVEWPTRCHDKTSLEQPGNQ